MTINGVRGYYLLCWGIGYIGVGLSYIIADSPSRKASFSWLPFWQNPNQWGWVFLAAGIIAIVTAWRAPGRATNRGDRWGFTALFTAALIWSVIYGVASFVVGVISPLATVLIFAPMAGPPCGLTDGERTTQRRPAYDRGGVNVWPSTPDMFLSVLPLPR